MSDILIARQPIHDRGLRTVGYELSVASAEGSSPAAEWSALQLLVTTFVRAGLDTIVGPTARIFLPVTPALLASGLAEMLPKSRVVLQVDQSLGADPGSITRLAALRARGYSLVLVNFTGNEDALRLIRAVTIVALDVAAIRVEDLEQLAQVLREVNMRIMARGVDRPADLQLARRLGCELMQGFFFCAPEPLQRGQSKDSGGARFQLLARLRDPDVLFADLTELVTADITLSYQLLRLANSPMLGLKREVGSIQEAMTLLGLNTLQKWLTVLVLANIKGKPQELATTALVRARLCELVAPEFGVPASVAFTVGILSLIEGFTDREISEALADLPLRPEVKAAILSNEGEAGQCLAFAVAMERGRFKEAAGFKVDPRRGARAWRAAVRWAEHLWVSLEAEG
jgi:c-di-GMP phosphodiesterase